MANTIIQKKLLSFSNNYSSVRYNNCVIYTPANEVGNLNNFSSTVRLNGLFGIDRNNSIKNVSILNTYNSKLYNNDEMIKVYSYCNSRYIIENKEKPSPEIFSYVIHHDENRKYFIKK